jgi:Spy/CpxP family protein refolding chaperone
MKKSLLIVAIILVLSTVLLLNARPGLRGIESGRDRHGMGLAAGENFIPVRLLLQAKDKIGLSSEQEKKLAALTEAHEQWAIKFRADMEIQALKLRTTLAAEQLDLKAAEGLIRAQADMHAEMAIARLHFQMDVKALLTPEQLVKMTELKKEFRGQDREGMRRRSAGRRDRLN